MKSRLIGAAALSLMLASPAMAMHRGYHHHHGHVEENLRALKSGYGAAYGAHNFYPGSAYPGSINDDFDRKNAFN